MKTVSTHLFNDSVAFYTLNAVAQAVADQTFTLSSLDYPSLPSALYQKEYRGNGYHDLVSYVESHSEVVGYNMRVDLEGNILAKEPIEKRFKVYHLNVDAANRVVAGLNNKYNQERIQENIQRLSGLVR